MLGHKILQNLPFEFEIIGTVRKKNAKFKNFIFIENINVKNFKKVENLINNINPAYVINCSGLIKQKLKKKNYTDLKTINYYFPLFLDKLTKIYKFKNIHFSTDCVFDGKLEIITKSQEEMQKTTTVSTKH